MRTREHIPPEPEAPPDVPQYRFKLEDLDTTMNAPEKQWLIDQVLGVGDHCQIYGESGSGKTFLSFNVMMMLIRGKGNFAGEFPVNGPVNVIYMTAEGRSGLGQRVLAAARSFKLTDEEKERCRIVRNVVQFVAPGAPSYYLRFLREIEEQGFIPDVIIIDHLSSTVPGKGDSDQAAATLVAAAISDIQDKLGCAILMIHHTGYDTSHSRGMTNYKDILDVQVKVSQTDNPHTMHCQKNKDGPKWKDHQFNVIPVFRTNSCSIEWLGERATKKDKQDEDVEWLLDLIENGPGLNQSQIIVYAKDKRGLGRDKVRRHLDVLERHDKVKIDTGGRNAKTYHPVV